LRKQAKKRKEKKECIMGKHKRNFELSTDIALAGNVPIVWHVEARNGLYNVLAIWCGMEK